jgi:hypothetical protein
MVEAGAEEQRDQKLKRDVFDASRLGERSEKLR